MAKKKAAKKKAAKAAKPKGAEAWRSTAMSFPETEEGSSCKNSAFKARAKSFLFLGPPDEEGYKIMVRLTDSRVEAEKMAANDPDNISVGPHWITATFKNNQKLPAGMIERWVDETFRAVAPKTLVKMLD